MRVSGESAWPALWSLRSCGRPGNDALGRIVLGISIKLMSNHFEQILSELTTQRMGEKRTFLHVPLAHLGVAFDFSFFPPIMEHS